MSGVRRATWHVLTPEYPPDVGGVADYVRVLAPALVPAVGDVHVWCPGPEDAVAHGGDGVVVHRRREPFTRTGLRGLGRALDECAAPRVLLVEYVPHGFGARGMNVGFARWVLARRRAGDDVQVMFHEVAHPWVAWPLHHNLLAAVQRSMGERLVRAARRIYVSIPGWGRLLGRIGASRAAISWTPIPATVTVAASPAAIAAVRRGVTAGSPSARVVGHFGTYGRAVTALLEPALAELLAREADVRIRLLGAGGDHWRDGFVARHPGVGGRVTASGRLTPDEVAAHLRACDLVVQPFPDGVSSRRSSVMAALANAVPVVATTGRLTESLWCDAVALTPVGRAADLVDVVSALLGDAARREALGRAGARAYEEHFTIARTVVALVPRPHLVLVPSVAVIGGAERILCACVRAARAIGAGARVSAVLPGEGPLRAALEAAGATVRVLALPERLAQAGEGGPDGSAGLSGVRAIGRALSRWPATRAYVRTLRPALAELRPTLVHAHGIKAVLLAARALPPGVPLVWHVHDFVADRRLVSRLVRRVASRVTCAIAVSEAVRRDLARVAPSLPVTVVHNGVDLLHFAPAPRDGAGLDRLAGLPSDDSTRVRVGLVATYAHWKGHEVFLRALARQGPSVRGYVVGGPIYATTGSQVTLDGLREVARTLGLADRVGFVPFQPDPVDVYRMLDVVVHASTRPEPFGLTVAEARACGRAVVVAAAGGVLEQFDPGETVIGHAPGDVEGLATAIERLARDPDLRASLGARGRAVMERRFGAARFTDDLEAVYARIAAPASRPA